MSSFFVSSFFLFVLSILFSSFVYFPNSLICCLCSLLLPTPLLLLVRINEIILRDYSEVDPKRRQTQLNREMTNLVRLFWEKHGANTQRALKEPLRLVLEVNILVRIEQINNQLGPHSVSAGELQKTARNPFPLKTICDRLQIVCTLLQLQRFNNSKVKAM
jgi:hypothetical protein